MPDGNLPVRQPPAAAQGIAIIGMACRLPGAATPEEFWRIISSGTDMVRHFSRAELEAMGVPASEAAAERFVPAGAVLDGIDLFDAAFFNLIPRHAELLDPQQRLLLECAWEALESAGRTPEDCAGGVGVYLSVTRSSYPQGPLKTEAESLVALASADKDYAALRVSY